MAEWRWAVTGQGLPGQEARQVSLCLQFPPSPYSPSSSLPFIHPSFHSFRQVPPIVSRHACASGGQFREALHRLWCTRLLPASVTVTGTHARWCWPAVTTRQRVQSLGTVSSVSSHLHVQHRVSIIKEYHQSSVFVRSLKLAGWPLNIKYI